MTARECVPSQQYSMTLSLYSQAAVAVFYSNLGELNPRLLTHTNSLWVWYFCLRYLRQLKGDEHSYIQWVTSPGEEDPRVSQLSCEAGKSHRNDVTLVDGAAKWQTRRFRSSILLTHPGQFSKFKITNATNRQINGQTPNN